MSPFPPSPASPEPAPAPPPRAHRAPLRLTWILIAVNTAVYGLQWAVLTLGLDPVYWFGLSPVLAISHPWAVVTSGFLHSMSQPGHLLVNMWSLWICGQMLERELGSTRFGIVYLFSLVGGSAGVLLLSPPASLTVGASGAVFGLFGAVLALALWGGRVHRANLAGILLLLALSLVFGFLTPGISWQGHLGGLVGGVLTTGALLALDRGRVRRRRAG